MNGIQEIFNNVTLDKILCLADEGYTFNINDGIIAEIHTPRG